MNLVWIGLALVALGALAGLVQQKWSLLAVLAVAAGFGLAGYGFFSSQSQSQVIEETVLASDEAGEPGRSAAVAPGGGAMDEAPDIPEHVIKGISKPWVAALKKVLASPKDYPLLNSGVAQEGVNKGDEFYEYSKLKLADRVLDVVFISRSPDDPGVWMMHLEPGEANPPIEAAEFGDVAVIGQGEGFIMFQIKSGPFSGDYLVWGSDENDNGGRIVRLYAPAYLEREHARKQSSG